MYKCDKYTRFINLTDTKYVQRVQNLIEKGFNFKHIDKNKFSKSFESFGIDADFINNTKGKHLVVNIVLEFIKKSINC